MSELMFASLTGKKLWSLYGDVGQDGLFIFYMTELLFPSLTGAKTDCLFGKVGFIFCVLVNPSWLTSPTGTSKRLVHAEIALSLVALLGFVTFRDRIAPRLWTFQTMF